jgi:hypothetical protein
MRITCHTVPFVRAAATFLVIAALLAAPFLVTPTAMAPSPDESTACGCGCQCQCSKAVSVAADQNSEAACPCDVSNSRDVPKAPLEADLPRSHAGESLSGPCHGGEIIVTHDLLMSMAPVVPSDTCGPGPPLYLLHATLLI